MRRCAADVPTVRLFLATPSAAPKSMSPNPAEKYGFSRSELGSRLAIRPSEAWLSEGFIAIEAGLACVELEPVEGKKSFLLPRTASWVVCLGFEPEAPGVEAEARDDIFEELPSCGRISLKSPQPWKSGRTLGNNDLAHARGKRYIQTIFVVQDRGRKVVQISFEGKNRSSGDRSSASPNPISILHCKVCKAPRSLPNLLQGIS